jgi:phosphoinositide-3-kinase, regulatory subunit 4
VGVGTFVGTRSIEEFILPLMMQALTGTFNTDLIDAEEFVVEVVMNSLASLAEIGLIPKSKAKELLQAVVPLLSHPNKWIRYSSVSFLSATTKFLKPIDIICVAHPMALPYLKSDIAVLNELSLLENLKPAVYIF